MIVFSRIMSVLTCTAALLAAVSFAQAPPPPHPPAPAKPAKIVGKARVFHFQQVNKSSVEVDFLKRGKTSMKAWFETSGQILTQPAYFRIFFQSFAQGYQYKYNHQLTILANDEALFSGEARIEMSSCDPKGTGECYELLLSPAIPYNTLERIVKSANVTLQLGTNKWELHPEEKKNFGDLINSIGQ